MLRVKILLFLLLGLLSPAFMLNNQKAPARLEDVSVPPSKQAAVLTGPMRGPTVLQTDPPVSIDGNQDFNDTAAARGWPGNGTAANPYIINGLNITGPSGSNLIEIRNIDAYFQLINCSLSGGIRGISLNNVTNGYISRNTLYSNSLRGIEIYSSVGNIIATNTAYNNALDGIYLAASNHSTIFNNTAYGNGWDGIRFEPIIATNAICVNNTVSANRAHNNVEDGILLLGAKNNIISDNIIFNNSWKGIRLDGSSGNDIKNNTIYFSGEDGIWLRNSNDTNILSNQVNDSLWTAIRLGVTSLNNTISYNVFARSTNEGVRISQTDNNTVSWNNFINNGGGSAPQGFDEGKENIFKYNYWSDLTEPDDDDDSIVDSPYVLPGVANNQDSFALASSLVFGDHALSTPRVIFPSGGEILYGPITILWTPALDALGHTITYTVFYSSDGGSTWNELATVPTDLNYTLESTTVPPDTNYKLKILANDSQGLVAESVSSGAFALAATAHTLSSPTVTYPNGGEVLSETVTIQWNAAIDSWGNTVTYTIYYSPNNGQTYQLLVRDLTTTSYEWDTTAVSDGDRHRIRVEAEESMGLTAGDASDGSFSIQNGSPITSEGDSSAPDQSDSDEPSNSNGLMSLVLAGGVLVGSISLGSLVAVFLRRRKLREVERKRKPIRPY
ncbi:MAG: right-handed parallel beta-helix repeat-containing protein [Candidatus Hodarchaeales archaeon]|jgi:parallel beta-helix repeat protein